MHGMLYHMVDIGTMVQQPELFRGQGFVFEGVKKRRSELSIKALSVLQVRMLVDAKK